MLPDVDLVNHFHQTHYRQHFLCTIWTNWFFFSWRNFATTCQWCCYLILVDVILCRSALDRRCTPALYFPTEACRPFDELSTQRPIEALLVIKKIHITTLQCSCQGSFTLWEQNGVNMATSTNLVEALCFLSSVFFLKMPMACSYVRKDSFNHFKWKNVYNYFSQQLVVN